MKKLLILLIAIVLTVTAVAQSVTVESTSKRILHYNREEQKWSVWDKEYETRTIVWGPQTASISCPGTRTNYLTFTDARNEDGWNYTKNVFEGYDQDGEPIEFTHLFYYENGVLPGVSADSYVILLQYMNRDIKVLYTIYDYLTK